MRLDLIRSTMNQLHAYSSNWAEFEIKLQKYKLHKGMLTKTFDGFFDYWITYKQNTEGIHSYFIIVDN